MGKINTIKILHTLIYEDKALCAGEIGRYWGVENRQVYPYLVAAKKAGYVKQQRYKLPAFYFRRGEKPRYAWKITEKGKQRYEFINLEFYVTNKKHLEIELTCGKCGKKDIRLYRIVGEDYTPQEIRCNICLLRESRKFHIPLLPSVVGTILQLSLEPEEKTIHQAIRRFFRLSEASSALPQWTEKGFE